MPDSNQHSELREEVEYVRQGVAYPGQPWHEFITFAEGLDSDIGPFFGRDSATVARYARSLEEQFDAAMDCMNYAWTIICNVSEGDWTKQTQEWQDAAARCRDQYHALLASNPAKRPT